MTENRAWSVPKTRNRSFCCTVCISQAKSRLMMSAARGKLLCASTRLDIEGVDRLSELRKMRPEQFSDLHRKWPERFSVCIVLSRVLRRVLGKLGMHAYAVKISYMSARASGSKALHWFGCLELLSLSRNVCSQCPGLVLCGSRPLCLMLLLLLPQSLLPICPPHRLSCRRFGTRRRRACCNAALRL